MARVCDLCGKRRQAGNRVSHAHNKTRRVFNPNLHHVRALIEKTIKKIRVCTRCIRSGKVIKAV